MSRLSRTIYYDRSQTLVKHPMRTFADAPNTVPRSPMSRPIIVRYGVAAASVGFVLLVHGPFESWVGPGPPLILFIPALTFSAWFGGFGPGMLTTGLSVLVCNYLYFPPVGSLRLESGYDLFQLGLFLLEGTLTSVLMKQ